MIYLYQVEVHDRVSVGDGSKRGAVESDRVSAAFVPTVQSAQATYTRRSKWYVFRHLDQRRGSRGSLDGVGIKMISLEEKPF